MTVRQLALSAAVALPTALAAEGDPVRKPVIGINIDVRPKADGNGLTYGLSTPYVDAVMAAGGVPIVFPATESFENLQQMAAMVDGFVFIGGPDINPARYGQEKHETVKILPPRREEFDMAFMEVALGTEKPVLAVCLGMQELNVLRGGTLIQDIASLAPSDVVHRAPDGEPYAAHTATVTKGTRLYEILGETTITVNSIHHQAVGELGDGIVASAVAPDGIVEAIELKDHPFAIGLQWHPEMLIAEERHLKLFKGLVEEAARQKLRGAEVAAE